MRTSLSLALSLVLGGALACSSSTSSTPAPSVSTQARITAIGKLTGNATAGKTVYETKSSPTCLSCHKADGSGGPVSGLADPADNLAEPSKNDSVEELAGYILNGKGSSMPKQTVLTDQDVADVVAYMKATFGK